jgi:hypothetical protein
VHRQYVSSSGSFILVTIADDRHAGHDAGAARGVEEVDVAAG